jgi:hypothetical protein
MSTCQLSRAAGPQRPETTRISEVHGQDRHHHLDAGHRRRQQLRLLRRAMAGAHPDRGGTAEQFIEARRRYQTALRFA